MQLDEVGYVWYWYECNRGGIGWNSVEEGGVVAKGWSINVRVPHSTETSGCPAQPQLT